MFVQHSGIVLVFLCFPHHFPHFPHFLHQTHNRRERLWWLAASGRPNPRPPRDQPGTGPRHSFCQRERWEKGGKNGGKLNRKWKGKHGKALCHRFLLMFLFYLFWMIHCIYLQLLYLHMSIRFCHFLSESPIRSTLDEFTQGVVHWAGEPFSEQTPVSCSMFHSLTN